MAHLQLRYPAQITDASASPKTHCIDVPNVTTALIVAEINQLVGEAQITNDGRILATIENTAPADGSGRRAFWRIAGAR